MTTTLRFFLAKGSNNPFLEMPEMIAECMAKVPYIAIPSLEDYIETDTLTRRMAQTLSQPKIN